MTSRAGHFVRQNSHLFYAAPAAVFICCQNGFGFFIPDSNGRCSQVLYTFPQAYRKNKIICTFLDAGNMSKNAIVHINRPPVKNANKYIIFEFEVIYMDITHALNTT